MTTFTSSLEKLSATASPAEYLATQNECLAVATEEEALQISQIADSGSSMRLDSLQILYWLTSLHDRVSRFQKLFEEAAEQEREFLTALIFRAITERTVRSSHPERVDRYLQSVRKEFAKSLFVS
jgi:hypothetical protein